MAKKKHGEVRLVPPEQIPKAEACPVEDLVALYNTCLLMTALCKTEGGVGLAAVQVGIPWNLFLVFRKGFFEYYVNTDYKPVGNVFVDSFEGCLSLRTDTGEFRRFKVARHSQIRISGKRLVTEEQLSLVDVDEVVDTPDSIVFQHEADHVARGLLLTDVGREVELTPL